MVFLVVMPLLAGFANFLVPLMIGARDVAFPRLNALSYWLFALGGVVLMLSFFAEGWCGAGGLDGVPTALDAGSRQRPGPVDPLPPHPHGIVARGRDQLHRDDPQHADARDVVDADAALRLVDPALRVAPHGHPADALPRASRSCSSTGESRSGPGTSRRTSSTRRREDHPSSTSTRSGSSAIPRCT